MSRAKVFSTLLSLGGLILLTTSCSPNTQEPSNLSYSDSSEVALDVSQVVYGAKPPHVEAFMLTPTKAPALAEKDFRAGHCNLYAVYGYAADFPGVNLVAETSSTALSTKSKNERIYQAIYVNGTSDTGGPFNAQGRAFAEAYNRVAVKNCGVVK